MKSKLTGLIAAPFTALQPDGSLNLARIAQQAQALAQGGVAGAFVCGTTGEGPSLTTDERCRVAEEWLRVAPSGLRVIVHVGHQSINDARALAAHAEKSKAHAFAATAPTFFRAGSLEQLVNYCVQVAGAAPGLPFYFYHFPAMAGADFPMFDFLRMASQRIPNLAGLKFTHENLMDCRRCLELEGGRFDVLFGRDELLLAALALGAVAAVGSTYNFMPGIYQQLVKAFTAGDLETARRLQGLAIQAISIMVRHGGLPAGKAMMKMVGLDCGPVRAPLQNLSPETMKALTGELSAIGFPFDTPHET